MNFDTEIDGTFFRTKKERLLFVKKITIEGIKVGDESFYRK